MQGGLVPVLVPLGSRGCRKATSQDIYAGWLGSGLGSTWFQRLRKHLAPETKAGWLGSRLGSIWFQRLQTHGVPEFPASGLVLADMIVFGQARVSCTSFTHCVAYYLG